MTHGWSTRKTDAGYEWKVDQTVWDQDAQKSVTTVLQSGIRPTRAKAESMAKKWVLYFRRGGTLETK